MSDPNQPANTRHKAQLTLFLGLVIGLGRPVWYAFRDVIRSYDVDPGVILFSKARAEPAFVSIFETAGLSAAALLLAWALARGLGVGFSAADLGLVRVDEPDPFVARGVFCTYFVVVNLVGLYLFPHLARMTVFRPRIYSGLIPGEPWALTVELLNGVVSGIAEELLIVALVVVLGRRAGWHPAAIVMTSVFVRLLIHVYYGPIAITVILWSSVAVGLFMWLGKVVPLILAHIAYDSLLAVREYGTAHEADLAHDFTNIAIVASALIAVSILARLVRSRPESRPVNH